MRSDRNIQIIVSGGGTGGHFYPAMAIAEALTKVEPNYPLPGHLAIHYIGSKFGMETKLLSEYNFSNTLLPIRGFQRYKSIFALKENIKFPLRVLLSLNRVQQVFRQIRPDAVIATGGYACGLPGWLAGRQNIPLFIQEQNAFPGITTRSLSKHALRLYYAYEDVLNHCSLPAGKAVFSGNPVRSSVQRIGREQALNNMKLNARRPVIFIFGGSQGALSVNRYLADHMSDLLKKSNCQVLWQTGERSFDFLNDLFSEEPRIHLKKFIYDMSSAYSAADLVVCRSGALSLAEIESLSCPAVLIPLPSAAGNHQFYNAKAVESRGAAVVVEEKTLSGNIAEKIILNLINDPEKLKKMSKSHRGIAMTASHTIADNILTTLTEVKKWS